MLQPQWLDKLMVSLSTWITILDIFRPLLHSWPSEINQVSFSTGADLLLPFRFWWKKQYWRNIRKYKGRVGYVMIRNSWCVHSFSGRPCLTAVVAFSHFFILLPWAWTWPRIQELGIPRTLFTCITRQDTTMGSTKVNRSLKYHKLWLI
jgi:hypothetical protein